MPKMLPQKFHRQDAEIRRKWEISYFGYFIFRSLVLRLCVSAVILTFISCGSKPTDLRTVIPADALVYLEANDLGKAIGAITENNTFLQLAKRKPDLSALDGIKLAVAVTGFETREERITDENSVLNFQPRFVAAVETNAWNFQTVSFTENKIGEFINEVYGGSVELETSDRHGGKYFVWTSQDGRKAYALVQGSVIFFGNDESAIEKCLVVKRGEAHNISKNPKITIGDRLAFGYVSTDGIAQIANLAGIRLAIASSEEGEVKSFVARVLPEIIRKSVTDVAWTATQTQLGIEDSYDVGLDPAITKAANETLTGKSFQQYDFADFVPLKFASATRYNLPDPRTTWRSIVFTAQSQTDAVSGKLIAAFSGTVFEPYAIEDPELFLGSIGERIMTVKLDMESENAAAIANVKNAADIKKSIAKEIDFTKPPQKDGDADVWKSEDGELAAAFLGDVVIVGDSEIVLKCLAAKSSGENMTKIERFKQFEITAASAVTVANETDAAARIIEVLGEKKQENVPLEQRSLTVTGFDKDGMHRVTLSDFGLMGSIIEQFGKE
ncbi:MAG: hypothetical protein WKF92_12730 [Pyrinomonadaceae bacterium]